MITNGPRLLIGPKRFWPSAVGDRPHSAIWLIAASLTAAMWPGVAVVAGHLGSSFIGIEENTVATMRAAVGLMSVVGSAVVMAPAFTLVFLWLAESSRGETDTGRAGPAAMGIIWPAWAAGLVLAVPPVVGQGPEIGEIVWILLGSVAAVRALSAGASQSLAIRRRWHRHFMVRGATLFICLFVILAIGPAMVARAALGASSSADFSTPEPFALPRPPKPNW